jgi:hypothetical protein
MARARDARNLFVAGLVIGGAGVAFLNARFGHSIDESTTAMSVLFVVGYVLLGRVLPMLMKEPEGDHRPVPRGMVPFLVCMVFAFLCLLAALIVMGSVLVYSGLGLAWAVSLGRSVSGWLVVATTACFVAAALCLLVQIAISHRERLTKELQKAFWILEASIRFPHLPHRF